MFSREYRGNRKIFEVNGDVMCMWCYVEDRKAPLPPNLNIDLLADFQWNVLLYSPYSSKAAPSDYHLFWRLKNSQEVKDLRTKKNSSSQYEKYCRIWKETSIAMGSKNLYHVWTNVWTTMGITSKHSVVPPFFNKLCFEFLHAFADFLEGRRQDFLTGPCNKVW